MQITALQDSTGALATTQQGLLQVAHNFFAAQAAAPTEVSLDGPLPREDANLDAFQLTDQTTQPGAQVLDLQAHIMNPALFHDLVRHLAHGKAPGPDGIPNEIIKYLPEQLMTCIHLLFSLMYKSGCIPAFCKDSNMVLLYKKAEPTRLENYRPITLAHTLYKLYTSLLSSAMYDFVASHDILSDSQEGFRPNKGTSRQLQMVVNMLSDAKLMQQDIYVLYIDFSSAFNTIYHHRLWQTMQMLGFDMTCIKAVQSMYAGCGTYALLAGGETERIQIRRGTL